MSPIRRKFFGAVGCLMVGFGTAGIFLPLVPTTPFLLLAAYLFAKSNDRLYAWLLQHKHLGPYIHAFRDRKGLTLAQKIRIGLSMSIVMFISVVLVPNPMLKLGLGGGWAFWMVVLMLSRTAAAVAPREMKAVSSPASESVKSIS